jgi:rare lipoprotein A
MLKSPLLHFITLLVLSFSIMLLSIKVQASQSSANKPKSVALKNKTTKHKKRAHYKVKGKVYSTLSDSKGFIQTGTASWYGPGFHGRKTANGEIYNMHALTGAHKTLPLVTYAKVTNLENKKSIVIKINDRGPFIGNRMLDLSRAAAKKLGVLHKGTARVQLIAL